MNEHHLVVLVLTALVIFRLLFSPMIAPGLFSKTILCLAKKLRRRISLLVLAGHLMVFMGHAAAASSVSAELNGSSAQRSSQERPAWEVLLVFIIMTSYEIVRNVANIYDKAIKPLKTCIELLKAFVKYIANFRVPRRTQNQRPRSQRRRRGP